MSASDKAVALVNGPASGVGSTVVTESGILPTFAKQLADQAARFDSYMATVASLAKLEGTPLDGVDALRIMHTGTSYIPSVVVYPREDDMLSGVTKWLAKDRDGMSVTVSWTNGAPGMGFWSVTNASATVQWTSEAVADTVQPWQVTEWEVSLGIDDGTLTVAREYLPTGFCLEVTDGEILGLWQLRDAQLMLWNAPGVIWNETEDANARLKLTGVFGDQSIEPVAFP